MDFYGVDIHYDSIMVVKISQKGKVTNVGKIFLDDSQHLGEFLSGLSKKDHIALEASSNSFWFYDLVIDHVANCWIINAGKFKDIANTKKKTDKIDARKIAKKLRYVVLTNADEEEFPAIYVPPKAIRELRSLYTTYELLTKQRTSFKNRIYSLFIFEKGRDLNKELDLHKKANRDIILNMDMSDGTRFQLKLLYNQIDLLEKEIDQLKTEIILKGEIFFDEIDLLTQINGISVFSAIAIMTDIGDINRFKDAKKLCSYLRTAPTVDASNKKVRIGHVNKQSRALALKMVLQGIHHTRRTNGYLKKFYERKKQGKSNGKLRIALVRKVFVSIFHMLKKHEDYYWKYEKGHQRKMNEYRRLLNKRNKRIA